MFTKSSRNHRNFYINNLNIINWRSEVTRYTCEIMFGFSLAVYATDHQRYVFHVSHLGCQAAKLGLLNWSLAIMDLFTLLTSLEITTDLWKQIRQTWYKLVAIIRNCTYLHIAKKSFDYCKLNYKQHYLLSSQYITNRMFYRNIQSYVHKKSKVIELPWPF